MYAPVSAISFSPPQDSSSAQVNKTASSGSAAVHETALSRMQQQSRHVEMTRDLSAALFLSMQMALRQAQFTVESEILAGGRTYKTYMDYVSRQMQESPNLARMSPEYRANFFPAHQEIVHAVSAQYIQSNEALLEAGAGVLDQNRLSYLASLLPKKIQENITYTDVNPHFKADADRKGVSGYRQASLLNLAERVGESAYDHVLSCCVFDTMNVSDTEKGCQQAFKVLKTGGKLIVISDLMPFQNTLFSHCNDENTLLFPLVGPDLVCTGVQMLDKAYLDQWLASDSSQNVPAEVKTFLQQLSQQKPLTREIFALDIKNAKNGYVFSQYIRSLFGDALKVVLHKNFFADKMQAALRKAGFSVCEFGLREVLAHVEDHSRGEEYPNYFINSYGDAFAFKSYVLRHGIRMLQSKIHVIVAEKKISA